MNGAGCAGLTLLVVALTLVVLLGSPQAPHDIIEIDSDTDHKN